MKFLLHSCICYCMLLAVAAVPILAVGQLPVTLPVQDAMKPAQAVLLQGHIGEQLAAAYAHRILAQDAGRLVAPFRQRTETSCWQSEFWGKWFTSAVLAYRYKPGNELKAMLDKSVHDLLSTQSPDGYIGNYAPDKHLQQWDIWGRKYCMLGLIAYYDLTGSAEALTAAARIADHLMTELSASSLPLVRLGNHRGMAASSVLEPIVLLYTRTANRKYLAFAEDIVRQWETTDGPQLLSKSITAVGKRFPKPTGSWYGWEQGQKAYEMMSCYEGLLELYRVTGNKQYKEAVTNTWESISNTEMNIAGSGSAMECWFGGKPYQAMAVNHYQETCVTATWIKLSQQLLRLTGEVKYADAIEQSYYNALLGAMYADGSDWAKYTPLAGERLKGEEQCHMGINCCEASGPRGLFSLPLTAITETNKGVAVNFFVPGRYTLETSNHQKITLRQTTNYPADGTILLVLELDKPGNFPLQVRIPGWSQQSSITVNGQAMAPPTSVTYSTINRTWKNGDSVLLTLDMRGRLARNGSNNEFFAIMRGPLVLARDSRLSSRDTDEALRPVLNKDGSVDLTLAHAQGPYWVNTSARFVAESHGEGGPKTIELPLCDYSSAGNSFDASSRFRVWIPQLLDPAKLP